MYNDFYKQRSYSKDWRRNNPDKVREYQRKSRERRRLNNWLEAETYPEEFLLRRAEESAKARGLTFNLTIDDIHLPESCPLLDILMFFDSENPRHDGTPSIDRIDNSKGYVKGNVWIISRKANVMKNDASLEELATFAENVQNLFSALTVVGE